MDAVNVFVSHGTNTFGLLVPCGCSFVNFVDMISKELEVDVSRHCINIQYSADEGMYPIRITNDSSLQFYLVLKRKDPRITTYALRIHLTDVLNSTNITFPNDLISGIEVSVLESTDDKVPNDLISGIEVSGLESTDDKGEEMTNIANKPDVQFWSNVNDVNLNDILPPNSKRPAGRPKNSRRRTRLESINPVMCGRCRGKGHNKRTCNQPLPLCHVRKRKRGS
ncbi:unnamed protein product [Fraxinus pennsylvanica]|uniref:Uncharacterized protein n=1 Tax=Fraxinus pennsylvanica TaxID=56036 RepID=A0AAD1ZAL5_9LAMI|nr:unnamed protein product [Fraxinus pennsylvanica]